MGCLLNASHVLTARHVWRGIQNKYSWPVVLKFDGLFRCEVAFESREHDIMVLRTIHKLDDAQLSAPAEYPALSDHPLDIGASVGIISALHLMASPTERNRYTAFASGSVAFFLPPEKGSAAAYVLSGCVVQKGMSGSAAFRPDGSLVGVFIQTFSFRADYEDARAPIYTLPVISPIRPVQSSILTAISQ